MVRLALLAAGAASLLAAPAMARSVGSELAGASVDYVSNDGAQAQMQFFAGGVIHYSGAFGGGNIVDDGFYKVENNQFCFVLHHEPSQCWWYPGPLEPNRPVRLQYQLRGRLDQFTLRRADVPIPAPAPKHPRARKS